MSDDEESEPFALFRGAKPTGHTASDEDSDAEVEDSFIVEDDNAVVPDLPAEFSMNTFQDLVHQFKIICQLFVHLAVQPVEDRREAMTLLLKSKSRHIRQKGRLNVVLIM